jgi:acetylornithine/succinyldiaminopimelate/putrescine aminotransferase/predicted amino acid dehydrogenase
MDNSSTGQHRLACNETNSFGSKDDYNYRIFCQPKLSTLLEPLRLNKVYHRSSGAYMWYYDESGQERKIYDFLGGYGAGLFGHNHPVLVEQAQQHFSQNKPFLAQMSSRNGAGKLAEKLNSVLYPFTKRKYVIKQSNSGAEAVELALKHAELYYRIKIEHFLQKKSDEMEEVLLRINNGGVTLSEQFYESASRYLNLAHCASTKTIFETIKVHNQNIASKQSTFLSLRSSFHGKSSGSVQLTHNPNYRKRFTALGPKTVFVDPSDTGELADAIENTSNVFLIPTIENDTSIHFQEVKKCSIAGFFIEPLQGEGGIHSVPANYLQCCRRLADTHDFPLIADEIQCGMGRTGNFLYSQHLGLIADYYLLSKSLGGGIAKIATVLIDNKHYINDFDLMHSSTFVEDDFSSNIAYSAVSLVTDTPELMNNCHARGEYIIAGLSHLKDGYPSVIKDIRGVGLMLGLEINLQSSSSPAISTLIQQNLLGYVIAGYLLNEHNIRVAPTLSSNLTIRLEPPATISEHDCDRLINAVHRLCEVLENQNAYELLKHTIGLQSPYHVHIDIKDYRIPVNTQKHDRSIPKVAFIGHFVEAKNMVLWEKSFENFSDTQMRSLIETFGPLLDPVIVNEHTITSVTGDKVHLDFIGICYDSATIGEHMKKRQRRPILEKIQECVDLAESRGCEVIGLGGYTSIIANNCKKLRTQRAGLTSGNAFTVAMGIESIIRMTTEKNIDLQSCCFAAVGATGNISNIYCQIMAEHVTRMILIGRGNATDRLQRLAEKIYLNAFQAITSKLRNDGTVDPNQLIGIAKAIYDTQTIRSLLACTDQPKRTLGKTLYEGLLTECKENVPIKIKNTVSAISEADIIFTASNSPDPIIYPNMLKKQPVVICDVAVPMDTDVSVLEKCSWVSVSQGGLVRLPLNPDYQINGIELEKGVAFACNAETLILGLSGIKGNFSYGDISLEQVRKIASLARVNGFELARLKTQCSY